LNIVACNNNPGRHDQDMWRASAIGCILAVTLSCGDSPLEEEPQNSLIAEGDTVSFEGLEATIERFNVGWFPLPSEGLEGFAFPPPDDVFMTFRRKLLVARDPVHVRERGWGGNDSERAPGRQNPTSCR